jgi:DNA polymerase I-like protein with 3'-5' exonuclease and polymerase domains
MLEKRLGQLADGKQAWLKQVTNGRIHARYNPNGAVTGRATHYNPNIAQVPSVGAPLGRECRELFCVPDGWSIVGADMSGLELRCLAHYLAPMDGGEYAKVVCEGDVHTHNQTAAGLETRNQAKTFIYAWLYGAGATKIGKIVGGNAKQGKVLIDRFLEALPAVAGLKQKVAHNVRIAGNLRGLDGRLLPIRSEHAALNTLLQSAGALLCKQWVCDSYDALAQWYVPGWDGDFVFLGWIHDELQIACRGGLEEAVGDFVTTCAKEAGVPFKFRVPLNSDYKVGRTWADTH